MYTAPEIRQLTIASPEGLDNLGLTAANDFFEKRSPVELIAGQGLHFYVESYFGDSPGNMHSHGIRECSMRSPDDPNVPDAILIPDETFAFMAVGRILSTTPPPHIRNPSRKRMYLQVDPESGLYVHLAWQDVQNLCIVTDEELKWAQMDRLTPELFKQMAGNQAPAENRV